MTELITLLVASSIAIFAIGIMIHRSINANIDKISAAPNSTNATQIPAAPPIPECYCNPPQGASGWRCGASPCNTTERLVTTTCTPVGCGTAKGVKEKECVEDSACCDDFRDTNFCGTGGPSPDCSVGDRIIQKICGKDTSSYDCRTDNEPSNVDHTPSCLPHCVGEYSLNEAAAIVNPTLPVICPGDDTELNTTNGPFVRDRSGVGILTKLLGNGVNACNHALDQKCELYCLNGYQPNPNRVTCDPISCQKDPVALKTVVAHEELPEGAVRTYTYAVPSACPIIDGNSYIVFNITLGEASLQIWNNTTSGWDLPSSSGDNNNLFESFKLYPLGADKKYFNGDQIKWQISQAAGDKDSFFVTIIAAECDNPSLPQNLTIQNPDDTLTSDSIIRTFNIPIGCSPVNKSSYFSVNIDLANAILQVYDVNASTWSEVATSGKNNRQSLSLKYHPMGSENRFFKGDQIAWRIARARGNDENYSAGITVADCYVSLCSGGPKEGWLTSAGSADSCAPVCASVGLNPGLSAEGMSCASGENRPMSGTGTISYIHDCAGGLGCNGNLPGPTETHFSDINCYRGGQSEDGQLTDITVACYCQQ